MKIKQRANIGLADALSIRHGSLYLRIPSQFTFEFTLDQNTFSAIRQSDSFKKVVISDQRRTIPIHTHLLLEFSQKRFKHGDHELLALSHRWVDGGGEDEEISRLIEPCGGR